MTIRSPVEIGARDGMMGRPVGRWSEARFKAAAWAIEIRVVRGAAGF